MAILLVRHADAGDRRAWQGPDDERPLSPAGLAEADGLVEALASYAPARILSSPSLRCTQTVAPLAAARDVTIESRAELAEGSGAAALGLLGLLARDHEGDVVLCSHGDVVQEILEGLPDVGGPALAGDVPLEKGSTWVFEVAGARVTDAAYIDPPG